MKASKTLFTLVVTLLLAATAFAQESPSKQINQIKRNNAYIYEEATAETAEEALDMARELLMQRVQEYVSEKDKLNLTKDVLVKNVNAKSETLSMMRGTMYRMFVYVKKNDIEAVKNVTAINVVDNSTTVVVEQPLPPVPAPETSMDVEKPTEKPAEKPAVKPVVVASENTGTPVSETGLPAWQEQAINDLMNCADMTAVKAKLNRLKAEYKVKKYGVASNCPNADQAYWVIFNADGSLNTVIGAGSGDRVNFRDKTYTTLGNFKGGDALWCNFAK
jgi:hypothetical protein